MLNYQEANGIFRSRRRKCDTPQFGVSCTYCLERGIQCTRDSSSNSQATGLLNNGPVSNLLLPRITPSQTATQASDSLPPFSICLELVNLYFDFIHDQFHSLFHKPSMIEDVKNGCASPVILLAMMALSARLLSPSHLTSFRSPQIHIGFQPTRSSLTRIREKEEINTQKKAVVFSTLETYP